MSDLLGPAYAAARWGWYLAAFLVLGASSYAPFFFRSATGFQGTYPELAPGLSRRAARLGMVGALALLGFALIRLWLQSRTLLDPEEPLSPEFLGAVLGSGWGRGWKWQTGLALLGALGFTIARAGSRVGWIASLLAAAGLALTTGMTGHAVTRQSGAAGWLLDAIHVGAGGIWLGGLAVMTLAGLAVCRTLESARRPQALRLLVADFSRKALIAAPLTVGFGGWLGARYLGWTWPLRFTESGYGWVLAAKVGVVAVVGAVGAYNWRILQSRLTEPRGESRLQRSTVLELGFGIVLLGITAVLVALPIPEEMRR